MIEAGDRPGFGQVGFGVFRAGKQALVGNLDGDETLQLFVVGQIDDAEAAFAQDPLDLVAADLPGLIAKGNRKERSLRIVRLACLGSFRVSSGKIRAVGLEPLCFFCVLRGKLRTGWLVRSSWFLAIHGQDALGLCYGVTS